MEKERQNQVYLAKLNEQADRYQGFDVELTIEERNLLSAGYENVIGAKRASWRILSSSASRDVYMLDLKGNETNWQRLMYQGVAPSPRYGFCCSEMACHIRWNDWN